ncbi:MAG: FAD-binding oxidoreductase [Herminiimonas sp.]|nr:FAD-binding oxidoreductase [Herminiimonas sp.]
MNSFWEQDAMLEADCLVIGAGLIGLLTALEWRDAHPDARIVVLERGLLPSGASSRNAGFACFGSLTELLGDIDAVGMDATVALVERRWLGLARLRARVGDVAMALENHGGFELLTASQLPALEHLDALNAALLPLFGETVFSSQPAALAAGGFGPQIHALVGNRFESQLHSGKLMRALARMAGASGIEIHTGATVSAIEDGEERVAVHVSNGADALLTFSAARVALCTNGMIGDLAPQLGIEPARGQVLITEPIADLHLRGCYHFDEGFYYFRNVGNRILLGGARNRDFQSERTTTFGVTDAIQEALQMLLEKVILPGRRVGVAQRWSGLMGFTVDKQPVVQKLSAHVAVGFGCNGMGVALGADIAQRTAALLA